MRRICQVGLLLLVSGTLTCAAQENEVIDRIVATVNGRPILFSDCDVAMRYEAFMGQQPLSATPQVAHDVLERLIDQELLRQQIRSFHLAPVSAEELKQRLADVRRQRNDGADEAAWQTVLANYGLTEAELGEGVARQMEILRFIDVRLRPSVRVDRASIETYYRETFLPELQKRSAQPVPLREVSAQIEEILAQQRTNTLLVDWLRELRQQSEIRTEPFAARPLAAGATQEAR